MKELKIMCVADIQEPKKKCEWGDWKFDPKRLCLVTKNDCHIAYEIDLEEIDSHYRLLDWIFHIQQKSWATPKVMSNLLCAFRDIFNPQSTREGIDGRKLARNYAKFLAKATGERR